MATETTRPALDRKELFRRLIGRKVEISTTCGTFRSTSGVIKEAFDDFLMFITSKEVGVNIEQARHWLLFEGITIITETAKPTTTPEDIEITR
jgi:hypothetical protein